MNKDRWTSLSTLYGEVSVKMHEEHFAAMRIANWVKHSLADYAGAPNPDYVKFYDYKPHSHSIEYDQYKPVQTAHDAVSTNMERWFFGLGLMVEKGVDTFPKTTYQIPIFLQLGDPLQFETPFGKVTVKRPNDGRYDFSPVAENIYNGFVEAFGDWAQGTKPATRIGFVTETQ